jgi:hypothetical protein
MIANRVVSAEACAAAPTNKTPTIPVNSLMLVPLGAVARRS